MNQEKFLRYRRYQYYLKQQKLQLLQKSPIAQERRNKAKYLTRNSLELQLVSPGSNPLELNFDLIKENCSLFIGKIKSTNNDFLMHLQVSFNIAKLSHSAIYQLTKYLLSIMRLSKNDRMELYDQPRSISNKFIAFA